MHRTNKTELAVPAPSASLTSVDPPVTVLKGVNFFPSGEVSMTYSTPDVGVKLTVKMPEARVSLTAGMATFASLNKPHSLASDQPDNQFKSRNAPRN